MSDNKINCDICRDLIPLVRDGVASADSENAVRAHADGCGECALLLDGKHVPALPPSESPRAMLRVKRRLTVLYTALMMLGVFFGLCITASEDMFFNCLIMPIVGVCGYLVFRWKALFALPLILFVSSVLIGAVGLSHGEGALDLITLLMMTVIYSLFALGGVVIAMLLRFAFCGIQTEGSVENDENKDKP